MHHRSFARTLCALFTLTCLTAARAQPLTLPIPDPAHQAAAQDLIHNLYAKEFAQTALADRQSLARLLLAQGRQTAGDARYVALLDASDLAASTGDAATAVAAIDELARHYAIDPLDLRRAALLRAGSAVTGEADFPPLVRLALETADLAAAADAFDTVTQLANLAEGTANKSRQLSLVTSIQVHLADLRGLATEYVAVKAALARLQSAPSDASAHLTIGRFYALHKGQWLQGLPHLAQSSDPVLADLATRELARSADGPTQALLADAWWDYAAQAAGTDRASATAHATELYKAALQTLKTATLPRIQQRIDLGSADTLAAANAARGTLALLPLVDLDHDVAQGQWSRSPDGITCAASAYACLPIPYLPPDEYDLTVTFTRTADDGSIALLLAAQKRAFEFVLDIKGEARFEQIAGKLVKDNPTITPVAVSNGRRYTLTVQVRSDHVAALLDGKLLCTYATDLKDLSRASNWKLGDNALCGLGANGAKVTFHTIDMTEVKGKGKPTR